MRVPRKLKKILKIGGFEPISNADERGIRLDSRGGAPFAPRNYWRKDAWARWRRDLECW